MFQRASMPACLNPEVFARLKWQGIGQNAEKLRAISRALWNH